MTIDRFGPLKMVCAIRPDHLSSCSLTPEPAEAIRASSGRTMTVTVCPGCTSSAASPGPRPPPPPPRPGPPPALPHALEPHPACVDTRASLDLGVQQIGRAEKCGDRPVGG